MDPIVVRLFPKSKLVGVGLSIDDDIKLTEIYFNEMVLQNTQTVYKLIWEEEDENPI